MTEPRTSREALDILAELEAEFTGLCADTEDKMHQSVNEGDYSKASRLRAEAFGYARAALRVKRAKDAALRVPPPASAPQETLREELTMQKPDEYAWLIETGANPPTYWGGRYLDAAGGFTAKHEDACRFARFQDAEVVRCCLIPNGLHFCKSVQHGWAEIPLRVTPPASAPQERIAFLERQVATREEHIRQLIAERESVTPPASAPQETLSTECCDKSIQPDQRYCPRCGWEARVRDPLSRAASPAPKDPLAPSPVEGETPRVDPLEEGDVPELYTQGWNACMEALKSAGVDAEAIIATHTRGILADAFDRWEASQPVAFPVSAPEVDGETPAGEPVPSETQERS